MRKHKIPRTAAEKLFSHLEKMIKRSRTGNDVTRVNRKSGSLRKAIRLEQTFQDHAEKNKQR